MRAEAVWLMNLEGARALQEKVRLRRGTSWDNLAHFPRLWSVECARPDRPAAGLAGGTSHTTGCGRRAA